jgi:hypothetical protein
MVFDIWFALVVIVFIMVVIGSFVISSFGNHETARTSFGDQWGSFSFSTKLSY